MRFATNDTELAIREYLQEANMGWMEFVSESSKAMEAWPLKDGYHTIYYCYEFDFDRNAFEKVVTKAWDLWHEVLGDAGQASGHRLKFEEYPFPKDIYPYCQVGRPVPNFPGTTKYVWNPDLPPETLVIKRAFTNVNQDTDAVAWAVGGHIPPGWNNKAGRHSITIIERSLEEKGRAAPYSLAHEMGHVFGLGHEHQRADRDHYVLFQCQRLVGYERAKLNIILKGSVHTIEEVCSSSSLGPQYAFSTGPYSTEQEMARNPDNTFSDVPLVKIHGKEYDYDSIMHYTSWSGADKNTQNIADFPLLRWARGGPDFTPPPEGPTLSNADVINRNHPEGGSLYPSKGDSAGILHLYPW